MEKHYDMLFEVHEKQEKYRREAEKTRLVREYQKVERNNKPVKPIRQKIGEQLIELGYKLAPVSKRV